MKANRIYAFGVHAAISLLLLVPCFFVVYYLWYPQGMADLLGVSLVFSLFAGASLLIWPFFTALVIKSDKREQRRDHAILWSLQGILTALALYFFYSSRVVWAVYTIDLFEIVREKDIVYSDTVALQAPYRVGMLQPFQLRGASVSEDEALGKQQRNDDLDGISVARRVEALQDITDKIPQMQRFAQPMESLLAFNDENAVNAVKEKYPHATHWLGIKGFVRDAVVLTDQDFSFFTIVLLEPWDKGNI